MQVGATIVRSVNRTLGSGLITGIAERKLGSMGRTMLQSSAFGSPAFTVVDALTGAFGLPAGDPWTGRPDPEMAASSAGMATLRKT